MPWTPAEEEFIGPGSGHDPEHAGPRPYSRFGALRRALRSCCRDDHHRRLSILSIVCGLSCIGAFALKYSVQSEERQRHDAAGAAIFKHKAKKFSIMSIVALFSVLAAVPVLMALVSYLASRYED